MNNKQNLSENYRKKLMGYYLELRNQILKGEDPFKGKDIDGFIDSLRSAYPANNSKDHSDVNFNVKIAS